MSAQIIRHASRRKFTQIDRRAINRPDLSFRALGVLAWMLDKPDGWDGFSAASMAAGAGREGRDAIRAALRELEDAGYLIRAKVQTDAGLWVTETWVYENPGDRDAIGPEPETENQASVNQPGAIPPAPGKPTVGYPGSLPVSTERDTARTREDLHHATGHERTAVRAGPIAQARTALAAGGGAGTGGGRKEGRSWARSRAEQERRDRAEILERLERDRALELERLNETPAETETVEP